MSEKFIVISIGCILAITFLLGSVLSFSDDRERKGIGNLLIILFICEFFITGIWSSYSVGKAEYKKTVGVVQLSGTHDHKCALNISDKLVGVRTVSYGSHSGAEQTRNMFTLAPNEKKCEFHGRAMYVTDQQTGAIIAWSEIEPY